MDAAVRLIQPEAVTAQPKRRAGAESLSSALVHEVDPSEAEATPVTQLDSVAVRRWFEATLASWETNRRAIDALNVFPVPDGDTGSNLAATMRAACEALRSLPPNASLPEVTHGAARGALLGARGNSGVIIAQVLRGLADSWGSQTVTAGLLVAGLNAAAARARDAVAEPAPGTILTVAQSAAAAADAHASAEFGELCREVAAAAARTLAGTVEQLPALTRAGVVDAGGLGLALMLDTLETIVTGTVTEAAMRAADSAGRTARMRSAPEVPRESGSLDFAYEVQYLLDAETDSVERLRTVLAGLGDSLVVVSAASDAPDAVTHTWNVHVHVNDIGAAVEAGIESGRVHRLSVTRFADQSVPCDPVATPGDRGVVVLAEGNGIARVFGEEGAMTVQSPHPSTAEVLTAIRGRGTADVIVLPDDGNHAVAESAAGLARADGYRVAVIPARSPVQALAALAVRDGTRRFDDDVIAMAEAAGACRHAEVTVAAREGLTSVGRCEAGDYLGMVDGDVVAIGDQLDGLLREIVDRMCASGAELVTVVTGIQAPWETSDLLQDHLTHRWPLVELQSFQGGQSRHLVWIGAE